MSKIKLNRQNIISIFIGFIVIFLLNIILNIILSSFIYSIIFRATAVKDINTISWISKFVSLLVLVIGGGVVGWRIKSKGWIYGGILGLVLIVLLVGLASIIFILPPLIIHQMSGSNIPNEFVYKMIQKNILNEIISAPLTIILTSLGGWLGERLSKMNK